MRDHDIETGLAKLVRDVVWRMEDDKCCDVLEANEALLKTEMELNGGLEGGHAGAAQRLRRSVYVWRLTFFKDELLHLSTMLRYLQRILRLM